MWALIILAVIVGGGALLTLGYKIGYDAMVYEYEIKNIRERMCIHCTKNPLSQEEKDAVHQEKEKTADR